MAAQKKLNLNKSEDIQTVMDLLLDDGSDFEGCDEEDEDPELVIIKGILDGTAVEEQVMDDVSGAPEEEEEETAIEGDKCKMSQYMLTAKSDIKWRNKSFVSVPVDDESANDLHWEQLEPLQYFEKYLPDKVFEDIAFMTNLYAEQQNLTFKHTTAKEIRILVGLHIAMGVFKFPRRRLFWSEFVGMDLFKNSMSRDRFQFLRNNLHIVNCLEKDPNNTDRFWKVRPIYDSIRKRCLELDLEQCLCVDEQMVPCKNKINILQYMKGKPCPWGIKIFLLCGKSGTMYDFLLYQGSSTEIDIADKNLFGLGASVVVHLSNRVKSPGHQLYFDNFFSSYWLFQFLKRKQIYSTGTVRPNRFKNPPFTADKLFKKKPRGYSEEVVSLDEDVVLTKWLDNRPVMMGFNFMGTGQKNVIKRWSKEQKQYVEIEQPQVIKHYNKCMGGVDLMDQLISLYRIHIKSRKWTLRMIFHAIDLAVVNSWNEFRKVSTKEEYLDLLSFRMRIAEGLIKVDKPKKRGRPSTFEADSPQPPKAKKRKPIPEVRYDQVNHLPKHDDKTSVSRCKLEGCNERTHIYCTKCNVHICLNKARNCFFEYHSK